MPMMEHDLSKPDLSGPDLSGPATPWHVTEPEIMLMDRYLSSANAPDVEEDVRLCILSGARNMILDCRELGYLTGAGARAFLNMTRIMHDAGGKISICNLSGQPKALFEGCGLSAFLPQALETPHLSIVQVA